MAENGSEGPAVIAPMRAQPHEAIDAQAEPTWHDEGLVDERTRRSLDGKPRVDLLERLA